jgi:hypothetical protein
LTASTLSSRTTGSPALRIDTDARDARYDGDHREDKATTAGDFHDLHDGS